GGDDASRSAKQAFRHGLQAALRDGDAHGDVLAAEVFGKGCETLRGTAKATVHGGVEAQAQLVDALVATADGVAEAVQDSFRREAGIALPGRDEVEASGTVDAGGKCLNALVDAMLRCSDEFGGSGGGGGTEIGHKVGYGEVRLVSYRGDDGDFGSGDGAGERLVVEAGEVLDGATAPGEDNDLDERGMLIEVADSGGDRAATGWALHGGRIDEEVEPGVAAACDVDDVADDSSGGRCDDADASGK